MKYCTIVSCYHHPPLAPLTAPPHPMCFLGVQPLPPSLSGWRPLLFPSASWLLPSLVISQLPRTPLLPRKILSLQTSASPSRASIPFSLLPTPVVPWAEGRKTFPPPSTLFPLVTPYTHEDYFFWQQVSSCQRKISLCQEEAGRKVEK